MTASYTPARHVLPLLPELPGGGATAEINSVAYSRIHWKYFQPVGEYKGVKLLGVFTHGPGQMFNTKRPITKVEDLAGMKIRSGGGISEEMARALGASAFVKPAPESYELLELRRRRRHVLPAGVDHLLQARLGGQVRHAVPRRLLQLRVRLLHERGQVEQAVQGRTRTRSCRSRARRWRGSPARPGTPPIARGAGGDEEGRHPDQRSRRPSSSTTCRSAPKAIIDKWIKAATAKGVDGAKVLAEFHEELKRVAAGQ